MDVKEILEQIEAGLEGVTPGPWAFNGTRFKMGLGEWQSISDKDGVNFVAVSVDPHTLDGFRDGIYIARCDPDTMRAIIAHVRELEARAERAEAKVDRLHEGVHRAVVIFERNFDQQNGMSTDLPSILSVATAAIQNLSVVSAILRAALAAMENTDE